MASKKTSPRRSPRQRIVGAVLLAAMAAGASACGNRLSEERLIAAAAGQNNAGINAGNVPGNGDAGSESTAPSGITVTGSAGADVTRADTGSPTPAGNVNSGSPAVGAGTGSGSAKPANASGTGSNAG